MDPVDAWLPVAALAFAAMPGIRTDDWLVTADLLLACTLAAGTIACLAGARITPRSRARDPHPGDRASSSGRSRVRSRPSAAARPARPADGGGARRGPSPADGRGPPRDAGGPRPPARGAGRGAVRAPVRVRRRRVRGAGPDDARLAARPRPRRARRPDAVGGRRRLGHGRPAGDRRRGAPGARPGWFGRVRRRAAPRDRRRARPMARRRRRGGPAGRWARRARPRCGNRCASGTIEAATSCGSSSRCSPRSSCSSSPTCSAAATRCRSRA